MKKIVFTFLGLVVLMTPGHAASVLQFRILATPSFTTFAYDQSTQYEFVFTANGSFPSGQQAFSGTFHSWAQVDPTDSELWSGVGGSGAIGTYQTPPEPNNFVIINSPRRLRLSASTFSGNLGLVPPMGNFNIDEVFFDFTLDTLANPGFDFPNAATDMVAYFEAYEGVYSVTQSAANVGTEEGNSFPFQINSVTISVPEPSTFAILLLGLAAFNRRRRASV